ncbi:MAG: hypothetical protein NVS9B4_01070 [Candidatus Acidiferrum sp.]
MHYIRLSLCLAIACVAIAQNPITPTYPPNVASDQELSVSKNAPSSSGIISALTSAVTISQTNMPVTAGTGTLFLVGQIITVDTEKMQITAIVVDTLTVSARPFTGSTAAAHISGSLVKAFAESYSLNAMAAHIKAIEGVAPMILARVSVTSQTASITATNLLCGGAMCPAGFYQIAYYLETTNAAAGTGAASLQLNFTSGAPKTFVSSSGGLSLAANAYASATVPIQSDGTAHISYQTTYATTGSYNLRVILERLQ